MARSLGKDRAARSVYLAALRRTGSMVAAGAPNRLPGDPYGLALSIGFERPLSAAFPSLAGVKRPVISVAAPG